LGVTVPRRRPRWRRGRHAAILIASAPCYGVRAVPRSPRLAIWGSELSPFALKLRACCDWAGLGYEWLPAEGGGRGNLRINRMIGRAKPTRRVGRYPSLDGLDEYPLVPFLVEDDQRVLYDTSA